MTNHNKRPHLTPHEAMGWQAHDEGKPLDANQYADQPTCAAFKAWREGWLSAAGDKVAYAYLRKHVDR